MPFSSSRVLLFAASMMASSSATLAASASPSCLEGDGACQGSARLLLQSKTKLDLDQLTFILEDKDAMHSSGLISNETVDELQGRAEAMVQNGQALSPLERTTLNALNKTLGEMLPTLQDGHSKDQAEIDVAVQLIKNCNKNFDDDAEAAMTAKREVNTSQNEHKDCRTEQSKLKAEAVKASGELDKFWKPLVLPQKPVVASQALMDSVEKWVKNNKKPLSENLAKNATAYENLTKKAGDCDSKQSVLESGFCQWFGRATAANKSYARCWTQSGSTFAKLKKEALASAEGRKFQYVAIHKIQCYMKVIFLPSRKSLNKCKDLPLDVSIFNLTNSVAEPQKNLAGELGPIDSKPGDESWKQSVYGGLSGVANVTPCAVAHFCGSDERVLAHRCVACGPGKENQAGDDALGPSTNCTAVLCGANQYVSSNTCKPCAAGTKNNASDDASGANTSCKAILCQAGQRVQNNSCHNCPAGTENVAGGHDASGADTSCDPIICGGKCLKLSAVLVKAKHGKCLDAQGLNTDGGKVHMWSCDTNNQNQQWTYIAKTGQIKAKHGKCLDADGVNTDGGKVHMWSCDTNNQNQQWTYTAKTGQIKAKRVKCLDAQGVNTDGGKLHMWGCDTNNRNQQWTMEVV